MSLGNGVKLTWIGHASFILETPGGKRARQEFPQHPAQPLTAEELAKEVSA